MQSIKDTVFKLLKEMPITRDSDRRLYVEVCRIRCPGMLAQTVESAFLSGKLPDYETVRRHRQKFQEKNEELRPSEPVQQYREDQERQFMMEFGA